MYDYFVTGCQIILSNFSLVFGFCSIMDTDMDSLLLKGCRFIIEAMLMKKIQFSLGTVAVLYRKFFVVIFMG
jgi:hypothetical protein